MDYRSIIESKYNRESWLALLHDIFKSGTNFRTTPMVVEANSNIASAAVLLGTITLADDNRIAVYEIKLSDSVDIVANRVGIRNLLISDWKMKGCVGAFMFCYRDNESVLRFSYVSSSFQFTEDGKIEKSETDTKRYTYLLGAGHRSRTAIKQFEELKNSKLNLADITKAFSIEALSDKFFKDYKDIYEDIIEYVTGKRMVKVANKWEEKVTKSPDELIMNEFSWFDNPEKAVRDYVKNLMGRIVFLQFIQKKGWLGVPVGKNWGEGDKEFLQNLYDRCGQKDNFIDGILELLFNDINTKRKDDLANPVLGRDIKMPYLNGGLFEQDKADECTFRLPKQLMDSMITFFSSYNFTIDENDPDDAEIGVDPEMLGRIFENLLEDNKDKGAFYTPKEIVQYMCRESLIAYLQTDKDENDKKSISDFVNTYDASILDAQLKEDIDNRLKTVKICDPAIGSGAFPMGLLKELFACRSAIEGLDNDHAAEIKKHIIQNNIYGVDIEKGAVDIARLRFWLSIIVDEKSPHALPNMDFKIMRGDSLLPTFDGKYVNLNDNQRHINSSKIRQAKKQLHELQTNYYESESQEKKELLVQIKTLILEIVRLQMDYEYLAEVERSRENYSLFDPIPKKSAPAIDEDKRRITGVCANLQRELTNPSKSIQERAEIQVPFFDWKIMFSDVFNNVNTSERGFDIVIGNPPYIQLQSNEGKLGDLYKDVGFETFAKTGDIYCLFYEKGCSLLRERGHLCFITSNKWMRAGYGDKTRNFLTSKVNPQFLLDFAGLKVFENATVDTNILLVCKESYNGDIRCVTADRKDTFALSKLSDYVQQHTFNKSFKGIESWIVLNDIEADIKKKIESIGKPLMNWDIQINYGIKTGCNEAFIINTTTREEILKNCISEEERKSTAEIIRPLLRGRDIDRYGYTWANLWLIATFPAKHYDIETFPALKQYLLDYGQIRLEQTGKEHTINGEKIKSRKKTNNKWFETQDSISYWDDFNKPKAMWKIIGCNINFAFDDNKMVCNNAVDIITGERNILLQFVGIMNSKLFDWYLKLTTEAEVQGGGIQLYVTTLEKTLVKLDFSNGLGECVENRVAGKATDEDVDKCVFEAYGLTEDEVSYILNCKAVNRQ